MVKRLQCRTVCRRGLLPCTSFPVSPLTPCSVPRRRPRWPTPLAPVRVAGTGAYVHSASPETHQMGWLCLRLGVLALENARLPPQTHSLTAWCPEDLSEGPWGPPASPELPEAPDCQNPNALPGFACSSHSNSPKPVAAMLKDPTSQDLFVASRVQRYPGVWVGLVGSLCSPVQGQLSSDPPVFSG